MWQRHTFRYGRAYILWSYTSREQVALDAVKNEADIDRISAPYVCVLKDMICRVDFVSIRAAVGAVLSCVHDLIVSLNWYAWIPMYPFFKYSTAVPPSPLVYFESERPAHPSWLCRCFARVRQAGGQD